MRYILNTAVIGRPGHYEYKLLTELEAEVWLKQGRFVSRVWTPQAAKFVADRFDVHCPLSREPIVMQPGDEGLIVRLMGRPAAAPRRAADSGSLARAAQVPAKSGCSPLTRTAGPVKKPLFRT